MSPPDIRIIHADDSLIVIDKPAGMLSVPGRGAHKQDSASLRTQALYADACIVHRLDQDTSGLIAFGRGTDAARALSRQFVRHEVTKTYIALVHGRIDPPQGTIDLPLAADWPLRPMQQVDREHGKASITQYRLISWDSSSDVSRVELTPRTGRTHQLRVHLLAIGHPIVGDSLYHAATASRLMLHAQDLAFLHPGSRTPFAAHSDAAF